MSAPDPTQIAPKRFGKRLAWLVACVVVGAAVGVVGSALTGSAYWYVAIPAAIAAGWLFFANPTACEPPARD
jgi:hypothetical protein